MPLRQSARGPPHLRTSSSDSDPHPRSIHPQSPKLGDRRSPRSAQSTTDLVNRKKFSVRISDLESQLGEALEELKGMKEQLASAEAAKKKAQEELEKKIKKPVTDPVVEIKEKHPSKEIEESDKSDSSHPDEVSKENRQETDVFEVSLEKVSVEAKVEVEVELLSQLTDQEEKEIKSVILTDPPEVSDPEKVSSDELVFKDDELSLLKAKLIEKEKELEVFSQENEGLKKDLIEANSEIASARSKEEENASKLIRMSEELEVSYIKMSQLNKKLEAAEGTKETMETEMKKLRVQTEQWRKAADAAASVLAGDVDMKGRRISERCGSMDKHIGSMFEPVAGGYAGFVGSPGMADGLDDGFGSGKRKGSGIRMFGDLWKRKSQK